MFKQAASSLLAYLRLIKDTSCKFLHPQTTHIVGEGEEGKQRTHNKRTCTWEDVTSRGGWREAGHLRASPWFLVAWNHVTPPRQSLPRGGEYHRRGIGEKVQLVIFHKYVSILSPPRKESVILEKNENLQISWKNMHFFFCTGNECVNSFIPFMLAVC